MGSRYANLNLERPFNVDTKNGRKRFDPREWELVGTGWHRSDDRYWEVYGILFHKSKSFFLVERLGPPCSDAVFSDPTGVHLSSEEAAKWCAEHDVPVPAGLETLADKYRVLPEVDNEQSNRPSDGLFSGERCLVWGGVKYDRLTPKMIRILQVLVDRFNSGFPNVTVQEISEQSKVSFDGGFIRQAFRLNRKGPDNLHPVHVLIQKVSDGEYRLLPPK